MDGNFPKSLQICASDPQHILRSFEFGDSSDLGQEDAEDQAIIESQDSDIETYGIAGRIWEAAYAMLIYLQPQSQIEFDPPCPLYHSSPSRPGAIIELGAGTGYLGLHLASYLSSEAQKDFINQKKTLVLTDLPDVCSLIDRNRCQNIPPDGLPSINLLIEPLSWGSFSDSETLAHKLQIDLDSPPSEPLLSHIICSDLVYFPELLAPLLRTLLQLSSPPFSTISQPVQIIISYMVRSLAKETPFWSAFGAWFNFTPVLYRDKKRVLWQRFGDGEGNNYFIFVAVRKPETLHWDIPSEPAKLLQMGSDAFETLLLMNMPQGSD